MKDENLSKNVITKVKQWRMKNSFHYYCFSLLLQLLFGKFRRKQHYVSVIQSLFKNPYQSFLVHFLVSLPLYFLNFKVLFFIYSIYMQEDNIILYIFLADKYILFYDFLFFFLIYAREKYFN